MVLLAVIGILLSVLCIAIIIVGIVSALRLRRQRRMYLLAHTEIPDFVSRPNFSLQQLLDDATISRIPFETLEFTKRLGMGAAGVVHQARWSPPPPASSRDVAVKELILSTEDFDEGSLQEFIIEIKLMSALVDPNVVEFIGMSFDPENDRLFLVLEMMERGSLKDVIERKGANLE